MSDGTPLPDPEALRRAALRSSWERDLQVGQRRLRWRWAQWGLRHIALPLGAVGFGAAVVAWAVLPEFGDRSATVALAWVRHAPAQAASAAHAASAPESTSARASASAAPASSPDVAAPSVAAAPVADAPTLKIADDASATTTPSAAALPNLPGPAAASAASAATAVEAGAAVPHPTPSLRLDLGPIAPTGRNTP